MGIQNSPLIEVAIGLVFLYLVFGLLCTAANEIIAQTFHLRADTLWSAIRTLLNDASGTGAAKDLYNHQLIRSLAVRNGADSAGGGENPSRRHKPSYIPASMFSLALVDMIAGSGSQPAASVHTSTTALLAGLADSKLPSDVQQALRPLILSAGGSVDQARINIESWFNAGMERASGWYKQRIQNITLFVGFLAVFLMNADTMMFANRLWRNPVERQQIVDAATAYRLPQAYAGASSIPLPDGSAANGRLDAPAGGINATVSVPAGTIAAGAVAPIIPAPMQSLIGWSGPIDPHSRTYDPTDPRGFPKGGWGWLYKLFGLLLTAVAASLGAPFWFDILNKFINIRSSGPSPNETPRRPAREPDPTSRIPSSPQADTNASTPAENNDDQ